MRAHLADMVRQARQERRVHKAGDPLNPVAEMLECIRMAHRWQSEQLERAAIVTSLADAWAADAIR